jgi:hypothetical protein
MNIVGTLELPVARLWFALIEQYFLAILHKEEALILFEKPFLLGGRGSGRHEQTEQQGDTDEFHGPILQTDPAFVKDSSHYPTTKSCFSSKIFYAASCNALIDAQVTESTPMLTSLIQKLTAPFAES